MAATFLWLLTLAPGILIIGYGANGILHKRLEHAGRFKGLTQGISYGDNAVGWGWIFIGIGLWALGQGINLKTGRSLLKLPFNILAACAVIVGAWVLFRRFL